MAQDKTRVSVQVSKSLYKDLHEASKEHCRTLGEEVEYLFEVMLAIFNRMPKFPLIREIREDRSAGLRTHVSAEVKTELYEAVFHKAGEYGLKVPELARIFWVAGLTLRKLLVIEHHLITKEDFVNLVVERFQKPLIH